MEEASAEASVELDLRGLKCPLPVLRTRKALARLAPGATLVVLTTDPMAAIDIPHMVREDGHHLVGQTRHEAYASFEIARREVPRACRPLRP